MLLTWAPGGHGLSPGVGAINTIVSCQSCGQVQFSPRSPSSDLCAGYWGGQGAVSSDGTLVLNDVEFIRHAPEQLAWLSVDEMSMLSPASLELTMVVTQAWAGDSLSELPSWVNQSSFGP